MKALRPIAGVVLPLLLLAECGPEPVPAWSLAALILVLVVAAMARACGGRR